MNVKRSLLKGDVFICRSPEIWNRSLFVNEKVTLLVQMGDMKRGPTIKSQHVIFDQCDKNFIFSHLNRVTLPRAKTLVLNSHPCEPSTVHFLDEEATKGTKVYVTRYWGMYIRRWCDNGDSKIKIISDEQYHQMFPEGLLQSLYHY